MIKNGEKYIWGIYTARLYLKINLLKKLSLKRSVQFTTTTSAEL